MSINSTKAAGNCFDNDSKKWRTETVSIWENRRVGSEIKAFIRTDGHGQFDSD
ncbi:GM23403 [Drosophila sechellia]|uniref:GM23403 n=1 Tax=Drosophila sechellia TaxID=7238 RepID=B4IFM8_DROSE|nr:GM23403 [Drosophila sechellia]